MVPPCSGFDPWAPSGPTKTVSSRSAPGLRLPRAPRRTGRRPAGHVLCTTVLAAAVACGIWLASSPALAYREGDRFAAPAVEGGAGGRFFTGAPRDGYGCAVCHRDVAEAPSIEGIPVDGWDAGLTYELVLPFPRGERSVAAALEIADERGVAVGTLSLVPEAERDPADLCRDGMPAATLTELPDRTVVRSDACGAAQLRVRWTAPSAPLAGGVRVHASLVASDDSGDPTGDAAATTARALAARGAPDIEAGRLSQRCAVSPSSAGAPIPRSLVLVLALGAARFVARRTSRGRPGPSAQER